MSETNGVYPCDFIVGPNDLNSKGQDEQGAQPFSFFKSIVEETNAAHFITDGRQFLYVNPAFETLTGYTKEALSTIDPCTLFPQAHNCIGLECREFQPSRFETRVKTMVGEEKWVILSTALIEHTQGAALLGTLMDITEYKQREDALRESERRCRAVFEFAPDMVIIYGLDGTIVDVNPVGAKIWGVPREEAIGRNGPNEFWAEEDRERFPEILEETLQRGEYFTDIKGLHRDGRRWFAESNAKVAELGDKTFIVVIVRDVTEHRELEEQLMSALKEKEMLLREIHHRVKNNMQIISTLLKLQLRNTENEETKALFRESQNRILSMAMIHEKLYQSKGLHRIDLREYVKDLANEVFASFGEDLERINLIIDVEDVCFGMDRAIPCGLIIIELLSNSLKYAFPEACGGNILIGLHSKDHDCFQLTVSDDGVGLPKDIDITRQQSLGLRLVSDLSRYQLEGEIEVSREKGTTIHVYFREREKYTRQNSYE